MISTHGSWWKILVFQKHNISASGMFHVQNAKRYAAFLRSFERSNILSKELNANISVAIAKRRGKLQCLI